MSSDMLVMRSIAQSNIPTSEKSLVRRFVEKLSTTSGASLAKARVHAVAGAQSVRLYAETGIMGAGLGAAHAYLPGGLDQKFGPIDGIAAGVGFVGGIVLANDEAGVDVRNLGAGAASVFTFRKGYEFAAKKMAAGGGVASGKLAGAKVAGEGDFGSEDPIVAYAKRNFGG